MILLCAPLLTSCAGGSAGASTAATAAAPIVTVAVAPQTAIVPTDGTAQFVATVGNLPGAAIQWEVNHVTGGDGTMGTINSAGLYQAPASVPASAVEVTAVLQSDAKRFGSADVTVVAPVAVSPRQAALTTSQSVQLQATGPGAAGGVNWSANGGTVTSAGLFTPVGAGIFTVTASSKTNPALTGSASVYVTDYAGQFSWRNDAGLTGQNLKELALTPANLNAGLFGKVSSCPVDGAVHAQPLYATNLAAGGATRNVVYVATEHDSVYAFDADALPCQTIWQTSFIDEPSGFTTVPGSDIPGASSSSEMGIAGTPAIDRTGGILYLVARTKENGFYAQRVHALDLATGAEKPGAPVVITASAPGTGDGNNGGSPSLVNFDPLAQSQRSALLLSGGQLFITFGGSGPSSLYHGWLLVYDAATLAQIGAFNSTPNGSHGGFTEDGAGASADAAGTVYAAAGRGTFDFTLPRKDFAQTLLKFQASPSLTITDTFTPFNQQLLSDAQVDAGSSGVMVLPDQIGAPNPRLAVTGATNGALYLVNRDNLGGFASPDRVIKTINLTRAIHGTPAYWQGVLYVAAAGDALKAYALSNGTLADAPSSQSASPVGGPGASPVVSSNAGSGGIVWLVDAGGTDAGAPAVLRAFDAADLARELYNSSNKTADAAGTSAGLAVPTVANGKVYVGTQNEVTVYGLLP